MTKSVVLVTVEGGIVQDFVDLHGETEVIVIDWDMIAGSSTASTVEAMEQIAHLKINLYPWREQIPNVWAELMKTETDWLVMSEGDNHLTYPRD